MWPFRIECGACNEFAICPYSSSLRIWVLNNAFPTLSADLVPLTAPPSRLISGLRDGAGSPLCGFVGAATLKNNGWFLRVGSVDMLRSMIFVPV
jgi:hypothetical protein